MKRTLFQIFVILGIVLVAAPAYAQFSIPGLDSAVSISLSPQYPKPGDQVQVSLQSSYYDLDASSITWTVNGRLFTQGDATKTITLTAGTQGAQTSIRADVDSPSGSASATALLIATSIDLLWEADSYVPPFYLGRALSSAGSRVHIVAIPHFTRPGAADVPASQISYTWRKDGRVLGSLSGRGKSAITIDGPTLYGTETISVEAISVDGSASGQSILRLYDTTSELTMYENQPLFGIQYHQALGSTISVPKNEMTFVAMPFFAPVQALNGSGLEYAWIVNQAPVVTNTSAANEITINAASSTGIALITLSLTHASNYFFDATGSWNVTFNSRGAGVSGTNPFGL